MKMAARISLKHSQIIAVAFGINSETLILRSGLKLVKTPYSSYSCMRGPVCNHKIPVVKKTISSFNRFLKPNVKISRPRCIYPSVNVLHRNQSTNPNDGGNDRSYPQPQGGRKVKPVFLAIPNPIKVIRNWCFGFIIRAYFDQEFSFKDFTEGAKQALSIISSEMSTGQLDNIQSLVSPKLMPELQNKVGRLNLKERTSLAISVEDILYTFPHNITVHYDDKGGKFLYILMRFWCLSSYVPTEESEGYGFKIGSPPPGVSEEEFRNMGSVISCTYEFLRELTPGVVPDWTVTHIQHGKLINTETSGFPPS